MPIVIVPVGRRVFAPSWTLSALALALFLLFGSLGRWQWERAAERQAQWDAFERGAESTVPLGSRGMREVERFQRVSVLGRFDTTRQFLLENRTHLGRAGYEVLTPLERADGRTVLVDRGWVPFTGFRDRLPDVSFQSESPVTVTGRADELPPGGLARGRVAPPIHGSWPKVASFPTLAQLSAALGGDVESRILLLDPHEPNGYVREWKPPGLEPDRHRSYAIQWWSFAALSVLLWALLSLRKARPAP